MEKLKYPLAVVCGALLAHMAHNHPCHEVEQTYFQVHRIIDGDTIQIMYDGDMTSVRLLRIDTPERGEPGYASASQEMAKLVDGKVVRLDFHDPKRDSFGRLLAEVYVDEQSVNEHMLHEGFAKPFE